MNIIELQKKIAPDILKVMEKRYLILKNISLMQPIGRRGLADSLGWTERVLRAEALFMKEQGLIDFQPAGMSLTNEGHEILDELYPYIQEILGLHELEDRIKEKLGITKVVVVAGDSDKNELVKKEMGRAANQILHSLISEGDIIALTGGSTVANVVDVMPETHQYNSLLFVPARGGIGEKHEYLANTLVSKIAKKTNQSYRLLHMPDQMSEDTYNSLINEANIQDYLKVVKSANILIHGIGEADKMARRRNSSQETLDYLKEEKADGEALGYYFAYNGKVVHRINSIGLNLENLREIPNILAIAGGESKARAILAVLKNNYQQILITDEGAARKILDIS